MFFIILDLEVKKHYNLTYLKHKKFFYVNIKHEPK